MEPLAPEEYPTDECQIGADLNKVDLRVLADSISEKPGNQDRDLRGEQENGDRKPKIGCAGTIEQPDPECANGRDEHDEGGKDRSYDTEEAGADFLGADGFDLGVKAEKRRLMHASAVWGGAGREYVGLHVEAESE